ncbi:DUF4395 domain-containing protein [Actinomadura craniellae]|uniref:DUF4395 domain-containing protein n=1 Tax=Actinomadura craniellae TaxID=2231787 RepID=A0A365GXA6_9ACTN|nr:DUF4395 domain-containing protein [Actinomadura craniellae]RAY11464.1 DUF4395 domain-containing protein [Actinomadura craniellae]
MQVDPRGQRLAAAITTVVLVVVLVTGSWPLLAVQTVVFAIGALVGLRYAPYGLLYQTLIRPRLGPPRELEAAAPPRFAQGVGLVFGLVGTVGYVADLHWLGIGATALALGAAFLNAAFGFCLGCEMYLLIQRFNPKNHPNREVPA